MFDPSAIVRGMLRPPFDCQWLEALADDAATCPWLANWLRTFAIEAADHIVHYPDYTFSEQERAILDAVSAVVVAWKLNPQAAQTSGLHAQEIT